MNLFLTAFYQLIGRFLGLMFTLEVVPGVSIGLISVSFLVIRLAWGYLVKTERINGIERDSKNNAAETARSNNDH